MWLDKCMIKSNLNEKSFHDLPCYDYQFQHNQMPPTNKQVPEHIYPPFKDKANTEMLTVYQYQSFTHKHKNMDSPMFLKKLIYKQPFFIFLR